jgi:hypothetical protein
MDAFGPLSTTDIDGFRPAVLDGPCSATEIIGELLGSRCIRCTLPCPSGDPWARGDAGGRSAVCQYDSCRIHHGFRACVPSPGRDAEPCVSTGGFPPAPAPSPEDHLPRGEEGDK